MKTHKISLLSAILLNMNILIGSAILFGSGRSAMVAGSASFLAWPLVALLFLPMVLSTAKLSVMVPGSGGFYGYAKEGLNITAGYISSMLYIIGYTFAVVVEIVFIRDMMVTALGHHWLLDSPILFNALMVLICMGLNALQFKVLSKILGALAITKILPLASLVALVPFIINPDFTVTSDAVAKIPAGLPFVIFGFWGFEYCCNLSHLIEDGERNASRATLIGFLATALLYTLFHFGALQIMGAENLATLGVSSYPQFLTLSLPFIKSFLLVLVPVASLLTIFAAINGLMNTNIVMLHSLAQERLIWQWQVLSKLSRFDRPWVALLIQGIVVFVMATVLKIDMIGNLCNLAIVASFLLPFVSLLLLQQRKNLKSAMITTVMAIAIVVGFIVYSWYQLGATVAERLFGTVLFIVVFLLGYALYAFRNGLCSTSALENQQTPMNR